MARNAGTIAAALDLGTTRIKAGRLDANGRLHDVFDRPAPAVESGAGGERRESVADEYLREATEALHLLAQRLSSGTPIGLACQRSSFVVWDSASGRPLTPLISWMDRRAARWCAAHSGTAAAVKRRTGLVLSPHYAGPKLAALLEERPELRAGLLDGSLRWGTLDTYALWCWTGGRHHETDPTIAARTLMTDPRTSRWSGEMLRLFDVPAAALPRITPTAGRRMQLGVDRRSPSVVRRDPPPALTLAASIADQASAALAALGTESEAALVNLGTGGFVLRPTGRSMADRPGYLAGPILGRGDEVVFSLEGAINGVALAVERFGTGTVELPDEDPAPEAFCLPDVTGTGSPWWRPSGTLALSSAAELLDDAGKRRIVREGIVFRVREILEDLFAERDDASGLPDLEAGPARVLLSGGLARDPLLAPALAACLGRPVELLAQAEMTLLGAARLAAGLDPRVDVPTTSVEPGNAGRYLAGKFSRWHRWLRGRMRRGA